MNCSSSSADSDRLIRVPLAQLHAHPLNPNVMTDERLEKLVLNIEREGRYPPLVARPHPDIDGEWQLLYGHQRREVLRRLGHKEATVYPWPCDDETALLLLATLNRLEGEDVPAARAELLAELKALAPAADISLLLPEDEGGIEELLSLLDADTDALLAELDQKVAHSEAAAHRLMSFAVAPRDEDIVESAIRAIADTLTGKNRRGQALVELCRRSLEQSDG